MRASKIAVTVFLLVTFLAHGSHAEPVPALTSITVSFDGALDSYSLGWEFTPTANIKVTHLGYYAVGASLTFNHTVAIYEATDDPVVSGDVLGTLTGTPTPIDPVTRYAYVDVSSENVQLAAGTTYVIASHWVRSNMNWFDSDVQKTYAYSCAGSYVTLGALGLYKSSATPCLPTGDLSESEYTFLGANFKFEPVPTTVSVQIDIKPGTDPNPINQGANGVIPVAILTIPGVFDAAEVDPATVVLNGASVAVRGKSDKLLARMEDVDGDGDADLLCQVDTECWADLFEDGYVTLTGQTFGGVAIEGQDYVIVVPPEP